MHNASIFRLISVNDGVITLKEQLRSVCRFVALHIQTTPRINRIDGHTKPNHAINASFPLSVELIVALLSNDLIPQEACCLCVCMGNERLFLGEFELEALFQKLLQLPVNILSFGFWTGNYVSSKVNPFDPPLGNAI